MTELRKIFLADGDNGYLAGVDAMSEAVEVIDYHHHEIHEGDAFTAEVHTTGGTAVNIAFKTPSGVKRAHMTFAFSSESKAHMEIKEGPTWTSGSGTVFAPVNQNRGSLNTSVLLEDDTATPAWTEDGVLTDVSLISGGTVVREVYTFASKQTGSDQATREELVLKPDETYAIILTSDDGSKGLQLRIEWYEHTDSN